MKTYKAGIIFTIFLFCISFLLLSCDKNQISTPEILIDKSVFLSEEPCSPPCFLGITPGESTESDVIRILIENNIYENCRGFNKEEEGGFKGLNCGTQITIRYIKNKDLVKDVGFTPADKLVVSDVLQEFGVPEGVFVLGGTIHSDEVNLVLIYPKISTWIRLETQNEYPYLLEQSSRITRVIYGHEIDETDYSEWQGWMEWHGFGKY